MRIVSHSPSRMAAAPCWTWNSNDEPPVIVPSMYLWSMRKYSASVTGSSIIIWWLPPAPM